MPQLHRVNVVFRLLAAMLALVALPFAATGVEALHSNWNFTAASFGVVLIFGYVAITGKTPFPFQ
jgi:hypothetical protein